ncbi:MAG: hypothetical protein EBQ94_02885 [Flavobacteriales bacterium]|nr:hypothetical protein [Flavobacteriales bacterium]
MKRFISFILGLSVLNIKAQQAPTGNVPANNSTAQSASAWYRGGNNFVGNGNNIFGTRWNSGIYTMTNGQYRMKLNGTVNYAVNGYNGNRDGYLLLGQAISGNYNSPNEGAASLLHLNGKISSAGFMASLGYRPWMQTGITMTDNDDLSYFGLRKVGSGVDKTETTICWTNDVIGGGLDSDDMVFRFSSGGALLPNGFPNINGFTINNNLTLADDLDGRHIARFTSDGRMGLGNTFGVNGTGDPVLYSRPQSLLHISYSDNSGIWSQYTNRGNSTGTTQGTGEAVSDGLRVGIFGSTNNDVNGIAGVYNHENRPLLLSTNATTHDKDPLNGKTSERVRITSVSAPTSLFPATPTSLYGVFNPSNIAIISPNITRVSISHNPDNPVTRPLSLLHLGYNTTNYTTLNGWRSWMDVGMFVSNSSDHIYLGLKNEGINRQDAVLSWGDDPNNIGGVGPDNLRFIFTSPATSSEVPANTANGLEVARMIPNTATTLAAPNSGMMGIGNFSSTGPNASGANQVNAKLDIDGDLRIRTVTPDNNLTQILFIDPTDKNRVHYRDVSTLTTLGSPGNYCGIPDNPLTSLYKIPLNGWNYVFSNQGGKGNC